MHLYFNGDSFVAGIELGDDILPNYPGLSQNINRHWYNNIRRVEHDSDIYRQIKKLEYERSFAYKTAQTLNVQFTNAALGGSSMDRIARITIKDLLLLKKTHVNEKIIAIIGTTECSRTEVPRTGNTSGRRVWEQIIIDSTHLLDKEYQDFLKYKVLHETDYHRLINFYKNVILIKDFCKLNDIDLYWVAPVNNYETGQNTKIDNSVLEKMEDYKLLKEYADLKYTIFMQGIKETEFFGKEVTCPGGHFAEAIHTVVATKLVEVIKNIQ